MKVDKSLEKIALDSRGITTLEARNSDSLDFYDISCWTLKEMLKKAYMAGLSKNPPLVIKTEDGYTFYRMPDGSYVDNEDSSQVDMKFASLVDIDVEFEEIEDEPDQQFGL